MVINGKLLAEKITNRVKARVDELHSKNIYPGMTIIQIGDDPGSNSYIRQKQIAADLTGIKVNHIHLPDSTTIEQLAGEINQANLNPTVNGIIVQRPVPIHLNQPEILNRVNPDKDIDGFTPGSKFTVPVARAVGEILAEIYKQTYSIGTEITDNNPEYINWLQTKNFCIIGRGETAGKPIAGYLQRFNCATSIINSQTQNRAGIIKAADVVVSCVGKPDIVKTQELKPGVILISVGIHRNALGKLQSDYNEAEIAGIASFYTPTPGGVGPVNVACLMDNLILAATPDL
jgi:methylenetetrahydrofolate dehydrogenase (NADP+)/methenyltetrahydrofolate cyclohydrolase